MKSQIKDIVIGIFAVIGFTAIVMGFTGIEPQSNEVGRYQMEVLIGTSYSMTSDINLDDKYVYRIDTKTGKVVEIKNIRTVYNH